MEAALRSVLKDALAGYVQKGLEQVDAASFPLELRDIELNAKRVSHELDSHGAPMELTCGSIGSVKITPGWMGYFDVEATNIKLSFSFSPSKAIGNGMMQAMGGREDSDLAAAIAASMEEAQQAPPSAPAIPPSSGPVLPPRCPCYCPAHDTSEKRVKSTPEPKTCRKCGSRHLCSYSDFHFCPSCSESEHRCVICGQPGRVGHANRKSRELPRQPHPTPAPQFPETHRAARLVPPRASMSKEGSQPQAANLDHRSAQSEAGEGSKPLLNALFGALSGANLWQAFADGGRAPSPGRYGGA